MLMAKFIQFALTHIIFMLLYMNLSGSVTKFEGAEFVEPLVRSINLSPSQPLPNFINVDHMIFFADLEYSGYHDTTYS